MNQAKTIAIIIAIICIVAGLCLAAIALTNAGLDGHELSAMKSVTQEYEINEPFSSINIHTTEAKIILLPSEDDCCRVVCKETNKITHTVEVKNRTLTITRHDSRPWYEHIGFFIHPFSVTVYLPADTYSDLTLKTVSGEISVPADFTVQNANFSSTSGDIRCQAKTTGTLTASSVSGSLAFSEHTGGPLTVSTTSGTIKLQAINASVISASTISGNIAMTDVITTGMLQAESVSGELWFDRIDADWLTLKTTSGNIKMELLSGKVYTYHTVSGHVSLPPDTANAGKCEMITVSGNIWVTVKQ